MIFRWNDISMKWFLYDLLEIRKQLTIFKVVGEFDGKFLLVFLFVADFRNRWRFDEFEYLDLISATADHLIYFFNLRIFQQVAVM